MSGVLCPAADYLSTRPADADLPIRARVTNARTHAGITPFATLWHWDTPQALEEYGGWLNASIVDHFAKYAEACFAAFGGSVKHWLTLNEPLTVSTNGYFAGVHAPGALWQL